MSFGFHSHSAFEIVAAADAEIGKPSVGVGTLQCNTTFQRNLGIEPTAIDLSRIAPENLGEALGIPPGLPIHVLTVCPPCTGFSRTNPMNHLRDDRRNSLVRKSAQFAVALNADIVVMENARELIRGNFHHHFVWFREFLEQNGYNVVGRNYMLSAFGLPQQRERAIVIAARSNLPLFTLDALWDGWAIRPEAITVRRAFSSIDARSSGSDLYPRFADPEVERRLASIPKDGGSWVDLLARPDSGSLLTDAMKRRAAARKFGSHPDVYGRMAWNKPAPTIKRECAHIGNGRYAHPQENRLCTVREMAALQGFPDDFEFCGTAISNMYRHIGDAVPPLIAFQLAHVCHWILTGKRPEISSVILPQTHLRKSDIIRSAQPSLFHANLRSAA